MIVPPYEPWPGWVIVGLILTLMTIGIAIKVWRDPWGHD